MRLDDGAANRQPYSKAIWLGRKEGLEYALKSNRFHPDAGVRYGYANVTRGFAVGRDLD